MNCPECGAAEGSCRTRFEEFLVLEFTDPAYGAVHHLTVAAYILQHSGKLTREGWIHVRELLHEFLIDRKPPALVRQQRKDLVDSGKRKFKITSREGLPVIDRIDWTRTILDVRTEDAANYPTDVTAWATSTLEDAQQAEVVA